MSAAIDRVDVVSKGENRLGVAVVVLQGNLHAYTVALSFHVDRLVMEYLLTAIEVLHKFGNAAGVLELSVLGFPSLAVSRPLISKRDRESLIEKREFPQPLCESVIVVFNGRENIVIRQKMDLSAALLSPTSLFKIADGNALRVGLLPHEPVAPDFEIKLMREPIHN